MQLTTFVLSSVVIFSIIIGCSPKVTPNSAPVSQPVPTTVAQPARAATTSTEDAAWVGVVEAAKKEGKVTTYSYTWVGDIGLAIERAFETRYGINLEITTGMGGAFTERLKTERRLNQMTGDMTEGSSGLISNMKIEGLLTSVSAELPALLQKDVWFVYPTYLDPVDKANLVWRQAIDTPWVNADLVKHGEDPVSWKDLLEPKWKGKMSLREPKVNAGVIAYFVALLDKKVWDEGYIKALHRQELKYMLSTIDEIRMLAKGEIYLTVIGSGASGTQILAMKAPLRALTMKEGEIVTGQSIAVIAKGPHPNATKVLLNWLFSLEGQTVAGKAQSNLMVRRDVPDFQPPEARTKMANPITITQEYLDEGTIRFRDRWYDKLVGR